MCIAFNAIDDSAGHAIEFRLRCSGGPEFCKKA